ncbi:MAG: TetR/AcrR family transcriptional regulator [Flavobacteriales bacterium]|nr:TetR/AcrR family transcriptional regulator [Flavobacteriales bacterium]
MTTREKIIFAAVDLFNEQGISPVTLRDIAEKVNISIGNLAYHFKNKDFIIEEIFNIMENERQQRLSEVQMIPSFENANKQALAILKISLKYRFFFLDTLDIIRAYPEIAKLHRKQVESHIEYLKAILDYSVGSGNMEPEPYEGCYERLARTIWSVLQFWLMNEAIRGIKKHSANEARMTMWSLVEPHLTEKGRKNFPLNRQNSDTHASA